MPSAECLEASRFGGWSHDSDRYVVGGYRENSIPHRVIPNRLGFNLTGEPVARLPSRNRGDSTRQEDCGDLYPFAPELSRSPGVAGVAESRGSPFRNLRHRGPATSATRQTEIEAVAQATVGSS